MFRKAALALALMASLFVAEAMDLPKPARVLTNHNKTKSTKPNSGVKSKTKSAQLCLSELDSGSENTDGDDVNTYTGVFAVFDCSKVEADGSPKDGADSIGSMGIFCSFPDAIEQGTCTTQLSLDTAWHKTNKMSSLAASFWLDVAKFNAQETAGQLSMVAPVITGANGAWGKTDAITSLALTHIADNEAYRLTINYKGRGWNPAAAY